MVISIKIFRKPSVKGTLRYRKINFFTTSALCKYIFGVNYMEKTINIFTATLMLILLTCATVSPAHAWYLKTEEARAAEVTGVYTLILYGGRHINDLETIAILDKEGDSYEFEPYAPKFDYKVKKGVAAGDALNEARKFVNFHNAFWRSQLTKILDIKGDTIGYEVRPLYYPFVYSRDDILEVYYRLKDSKVIVDIRLIPEVFNALFLGDTSSKSAGEP